MDKLHVPFSWLLGIGLAIAAVMTFAALAHAILGTELTPFCTMWKLSPRSPSKNNVSPFLNDRRVIRATTSRRSSSLSPPSMSFTIASL